jgi:mannose-1-phosphate guanylyltransferase
MVPVLNRPFLEHMIDYLKGHGIDDLILTLCYLPDHVQRYFGDGSKFGIELTHVVEDSPLGTAGAVKNVQGCLDETFFVFNGDIFTDLDLTAMMGFHRERGSKVSIALTPVDDPAIYGVVETNAEGEVQRFIEKPSRGEATTNMINAGAYIVEPEVLDLIPKGLSFTFERGLFPLLLERGDPVYGYQSDAYWIDFGTPEKYLKLHHDLLTGRVTKGRHGDQAGEGIWVEEGCDIHPQAELRGPAVIGKNCVIDSRAQVKGPSVIGQGCRIGTDSLIEGAILWQNTHIGHAVSLKNCVVAGNLFVGDRSQVREGCVLGDNVIIGSGESLTQGTRLWPDNRR